jgi:predicted Zn-dependent peptidase
MQEIAQSHDTPDDIVFDFFQETAYPDQPIGWTILGPAERVATLSRNDLAGYMSAHYCAPRMVLVGAGRIDHDHLVKLAGAAFDKLPPKHSARKAPARYTGGDFRRSRDLEQVHLVLGFDGIPYGDPDFYTGQVLSTLLGGGMSSRLFQEIRERRGLAYAVFTFSSAYTDGGLFGVYAGAGQGEVAELIPVMAEEMTKVERAVTQEETDRARAQLKSALLMSLESSSARCERLGRQMLIFGRPIPVDEMIAEIDAISVEEITRVARRMFAGSRPTVATLGPIDKVEPYDRIAGRFG